MDGANRLGQSLQRKNLHGFFLGRWLVALTLGGAVLGYPLFLWLDPLALFSGLFLMTKYPRNLTAWTSAFVFLGAAIASLLWPNLWCHRLCPLGAFQDLLAGLVRWGRSLLPPAPKTPTDAKVPFPLLRRTVLGMSLGAAGVAVARWTGPPPTRPLRPPGAVDINTFAGLCLRCGNCIRSCPHDIIRQDRGGYGLASLLTPVLNFETDYCREDCARCTEVCPSGAIVRVPLDTKENVKIGLPRVNMDICLLGRERECSACRRWCPYDAIRYVFSETQYTLVPVIDPQKCNGCGACQMACPTTPTKAIQVFPIEQTPNRKL